VTHDITGLRAKAKIETTRHCRSSQVPHDGAGSALVPAGKCAGRALSDLRIPSVVDIRERIEATRMTVKFCDRQSSPFLAFEHPIQHVGRPCDTVRAPLTARVCQRRFERGWRHDRHVHFDRLHVVVGGALSGAFTTSQPPVRRKRRKTPKNAIAVAEHFA